MRFYRVKHEEYTKGKFLIKDIDDNRALVLLLGNSINCICFCKFNTYNHRWEYDDDDNFINFGAENTDLKSLAKRIINAI